ncbi:hypothetical protein [Lentzea sp. NBRC 105346]|nr:hypothetical protein [Lentzea sp. NBRC 105346]
MCATAGSRWCWLHHCVRSADHVIKVTGHRWCRASLAAAQDGMP